MTQGTKEWADTNVNCYHGCLFNCRYCYAQKMAIRYGRKTSETWVQMIFNPKALKNYNKRKGRIMFPSSHDIPNEPVIIENCLKILKKILAPGNKVLITTKAHPEVIKKLCQELGGFKSQILFRFTITSINNYLLKFWEPNAPTFSERFESLILAKKHGFETSVSIEPFLDSDPLSLIRAIYPHVTGSIWIGPMSQIKRKGIANEEEIFYNQIRDNYKTSNLIAIADGLQKLDKIKFKDSFRSKIKAREIPCV